MLPEVKWIIDAVERADDRGYYTDRTFQMALLGLLGVLIEKLDKIGNELGEFHIGK